MQPQISIKWRGNTLYSYVFGCHSTSKQPGSSWYWMFLCVPSVSHSEYEDLTVFLAWDSDRNRNWSTCAAVRVHLPPPVVRAKCWWCPAGAHQTAARLQIGGYRLWLSPGCPSVAWPLLQMLAPSCLCWNCYVLQPASTGRHFTLHSACWPALHRT